MDLSSCIFNIMPLAWRKKARKIFGTCLGLLALIWAKGMIDYEKK